MNVFPDNLAIKTTEMHTGGEPLRIIGFNSGFPEIKGETILDKRRYMKEELDHYRKFLMFEPRGHFDMYGALLIKADMKEADFGVLFMHNEGFSTMCGHGIIALGRYAVDNGLVKEVSSPETLVKIQCPCGLINTFVEYEDGRSGKVRFHSVPAFVFALDVPVDVTGYGQLKVDISFGGAFYAFISADKLGLDVRTSPTKDLARAATSITASVQSQVELRHHTSPDLAFLYGTILTDGLDEYSDLPTANVCVFAKSEIDRCPTGSGVTARIALQYKRGYIQLNQIRMFESGVTGSLFTGKAIEKTKCGEYDAVIVEVVGKANYNGTCSFTLEKDDPMLPGFLPR